MPKTVQIRDLDDGVYAALQRLAAAASLTVPGLLRREATRLAARPSLEEWIERTGRGGVNQISQAEVLAALDDVRGPWPNAGD